MSPEDFVRKWSAGSAAGRTDGFADVWLKGHLAWEDKAMAAKLLPAPCARETSSIST